MEETHALLIVHHLFGFNLTKIKPLLGHFSSATVFLESAQCPPWQTLPSWQEDLRLVEKEKVTLVPYTDPSFPPSLLELSDCPLFLYVKGAFDPQDKKAVAIVGTRQCTSYGKEMAYTFGRDIASQKWSVVSGLARGIDSAAHSGALLSGRTIAVIGSGLSHLYPKENAHLAACISSQGAVVSEFPMNTAPQKHFFPKRNRLVSGLSQGTLLVEAPIKSGALITMDFAHSQGKKCFAIPGRVDINTFQGNHFLIKQQKAILVENPFEMLSLLQGCKVTADLKFKEDGSFFPDLHQEMLIDLDVDEQKVFNLLSKEEAAIEQLAQHTEMSISKLSALLIALVLKGKACELPGKLFKRV